MSATATAPRPEVRIVCDPTACELFLIIDSAGDYAVGVSPEAARERYAEDVGDLAEAEGFRTVQITVRVSPPQVVELEGDAPAQGTAELLSVA